MVLRLIDLRRVLDDILEMEIVMKGAKKDVSDWILMGM